MTYCIKKGVNRDRLTPEDNRFKVSLEGLHDPDTARAGVLAETAGNAFFRVGDIFVTDLGGHFPAGDGIGRTHGLAEMAIPALAAGEAAVCFPFNIGTTLNIR